MPREYKHIQEYEKEILAFIEQRKTRCEIGEQLGFSQKQIKEFIKRYHRKQHKLEDGIALYKKCRPSRNTTVVEEDKLIDLRYKLARKEAKIK